MALDVRSKSLIWKLEATPGIEPGYAVLETAALPLSYTPFEGRMTEDGRAMLIRPASASAVRYLVPGDGVEPPTS
jgi:hypothetical protein